MSVKNKKEKKEPIVLEYLEYYEYYINKFGKDRTLVLMQVGSFYEAYSIINRGPDLEKLEEITDASIAHKGRDKSLINLRNPLMWGFPMVAMSKYLKMIIEDNGYRVIIVDQVSPKPNIKREVVAIYSPTTYIDASYKPNSNFIAMIFIEEIVQKNGNSLECIGMSAIDVSTGEVYVHESYSSIQDNKLALDETIRFINGLNPKEIIIYTENLHTLTNEFIIEYLDLHDKFYMFRTHNKEHSKINFQKKVFETIYPNKKNIVSIIDALGLSKYIYVRKSLVNLLSYVADHYNDLFKNIHEPVFHLHATNMILGNDAINQLNITENNKSYSSKNVKYHNLLSVVNMANTGMGKRYIKMRLVYPFTHPETLEKIYTIVDHLLHDDYYLQIESYLKNIVDIERFGRKLILCSLHPMHMVDFIDSYESILKLFSLIKKHPDISKVIKTSKLRKSIRKLNKLFSDKICKKKAKLYCLTNIGENIFNRYVYPELDKLQNQIGFDHDVIEELLEKLDNMIYDKNSKNNKIALKHNKRDGYYYQLSHNRFKLLKHELDNINTIKLKTRNIDVTDFTYTDATNYVKISLPFLKIQTDDINILNTEIINSVYNKYCSFMKHIADEFNDVIHNVTEIITKLDYYTTIAKVAKSYNYSRPNIIDAHNGTSYVDVKQLRHPIVERIIDHDYIPHDISLGHDLKGIMIYGLNSAGKSVLMKSIGISVILAQAGFYVPAHEFTYYPYKALYTRITGNDNLFRGLSSFSLEMVELNAILKRADKNTLVIGDEVCRGTENISGNALVASTLLELSKLNASFVFATHLHELMELDEIKNKNDIKAFHLSVDIDVESDKLVYDRILKPGSGERIYGITVAKYIIKNHQFINKALEIKNKLLDIDPISPLIGTKKSKYNSHLIVDQCELCGKKNTNINPSPLETHHINHQKDCIDGFVKSKPHIKKNQLNNLMVICRQCHDKIHRDDIVIDGNKMTSHGKKVIIRKKNKSPS